MIQPLVSLSSAMVATMTNLVKLLFSVSMKHVVGLRRTSGYECCNRYWKSRNCGITIEMSREWESEVWKLSPGKVVRRVRRMMSKSLSIAAAQGPPRLKCSLVSPKWSDADWLRALTRRLLGNILEQRHLTFLRLIGRLLSVTTLSIYLFSQCLNC